MIVVVVTIAALVGFLIHIKVSYGGIDFGDVGFSACMAATFGVLAFIVSMIVGAIMINDKDKCNIEYTEYAIVQQDDTSQTYVTICSANDGKTQHTFTYINEDNKLDVAVLHKNINVVYKKEVKPTCVHKLTNLKPEYGFWFFNWQSSEYTLTLPSRDCVSAN